jgi:hypothetical protein
MIKTFKNDKFQFPLGQRSLFQWQEIGKITITFADRNGESSPCACSAAKACKNQPSQTRG